MQHNDTEMDFMALYNNYELQHKQLGSVTFTKKGHKTITTKKRCCVVVPRLVRSLFGWKTAFNSCAL